MHAKAKVLSVRPPASAGTSSKASRMLLIARDNVPRVNTNRRRISLTKYGMLKRPITATSPVATYTNVTARAVPSSFSASRGTTVSSIACATPGTKNRLRKAVPYCAAGFRS